MKPRVAYVSYSDMLAIFLFRAWVWFELFWLVMRKYLSISIATPSVLSAKDRPERDHQRGLVFADTRKLADHMSLPRQFGFRCC